MSTEVDLGIAFEVKTSGGDDFMKVDVQYFGLKRDQLMEIEGAMLGGFGMLLEATKEQAQPQEEARKEPGIMR